MGDMFCRLQNRIKNKDMEKRASFSPHYYMLKAYLDKLTDDQSGGSPLPVLYPEVNSKLEKIAESEEKKI